MRLKQYLTHSCHSTKMFGMLLGESSETRFQAPFQWFQIILSWVESVHLIGDNEDFRSNIFSYQPDAWFFIMWFPDLCHKNGGHHVYHSTNVNILSLTHLTRKKLTPVTKLPCFPSVSSCLVRALPSFTCLVPEPQGKFRHRKAITLLVETGQE